MTNKPLIIPTGTSATKISNYLVKHYETQRLGKISDSNPYDSNQYHEHYLNKTQAKASTIPYYD